MFCVNCGKELQEQWKACPYCGKDLNNSIMGQTQEKKFSEARRRGMVKGVFGGVVVLLLVTLSLYWGKNNYKIQQSNSENQSSDEMKNNKESVQLSYDISTDIEYGLLYANAEGQITDENGNVISEYLGYGITDQGYVHEKQDNTCIEGIKVDEEGKLVFFEVGEVTTEVYHIDDLIHDLGYINNNNQRYIHFTHREGDALYFSILDSNNIDILRNCPAEIVDSSTLRYCEPDYGYDLKITILDQYSFNVEGRIDDEYTTGIYYITSYWN